MADNRTMEEMLQAPMKGYGDAIVVPDILAENFEIKTGITSTLKFRNVSNDAIKLMLFPYSLEGGAKIWYEKEPPRSILTWGDLVSKFVNHFFPPSKTTHLKNEITRFTQKFEETFGEAWERFKEMLRQCPHHEFSELHQIDTFCNGLNEYEQDYLNAVAGGNLLSKTPRDALTIIENKSKVRYSRNKSVASKVSTTSSGSSSSTDARIDKLTDIISNLVETFNKKMTTPATAKAVKETCVICGGAHLYYDCIAIDINTSSACAATGTYNQGGPQNRISNQMGPPGFPPKSNENRRRQRAWCNLQVQKVHPPVVPIPIPKPEFVLKPNLKPLISYPSRLNKEKLQDKSAIQIHKFLQMFKKLHFNISLAEALALMPKYHKILKDLLPDKEKRLGLENTSLTENCLAILLKKLPKKLGDPGRFLIPCDFQGLESCMALADLGASINLMPLSVWKKLSLPKLTPTRMTLELATRSIAYPVRIVEDVCVQVGKFTFLADFVVVNYDVDPRVPLILRRPFLRTTRALVDVHGEELILRDGDEKLIFHADNTSKHPHKHESSIHLIILTHR
nr:reverse transcriptase domain-containing protein [Tanacetum cinerariifolium]